MATKTDLRKAVLEDLGILAGGESASAEDAALVERRIDRLHEELIDNGLVAWSLTAIPDRAMQPMTKLVAAVCWSAFHGDTGAVVAEQKAAAARARLARQAQHVTEEPTRAVYY